MTTTEGSTSTSTTEPGETGSGGTTTDNPTEQSVEGGTTGGYHRRRPRKHRAGGGSDDDSRAAAAGSGPRGHQDRRAGQAGRRDPAARAGGRDRRTEGSDPQPANPGGAADPGGANPGGGATTVADDGEFAAAEAKVAQWQSDWVQYDKYYRPLIFNPYPEPLKLVYEVGGVPRILIIEPLGRIVTEVRDIGSYNFTAMRLNTLGELIAIAVGNFFGGGYFPGPGLPPPPPPPPVRTLTNVPVQVKYTKETYRPIVVRKIVDVGPDPTQGGATKVLLDGVTPAWGAWKENEEGVPQFEVNQTQSFPGMEEPAEGPLPGDYDLQLVSDSSPTGLSGKDITVIVAAVMAAAVGIGAIVLTIFLGRRRRPQH